MKNYKKLFISVLIAGFINISLFFFFKSFITSFIFFIILEFFVNIIILFIVAEIAYILFLKEFETYKEPLEILVQETRRFPDVKELINENNEWSNLIYSVIQKYKKIVEEKNLLINQKESQQKKKENIFDEYLKLLKKTEDKMYILVNDFNNLEKNIIEIVSLDKSQSSEKKAFIRILNFFNTQFKDASQLLEKYSGIKNTFNIIESKQKEKKETLIRKLNLLNENIIKNNQVKIETIKQISQINTLLKNSKNNINDKEYLAQIFEEIKNSLDTLITKNEKVKEIETIEIENNLNNIKDIDNKFTDLIKKITENYSDVQQIINSMRSIFEDDLLIEVKEVKDKKNIETLLLNITSKLIEIREDLDVFLENIAGYEKKILKTFLENNE